MTTELQTALSELTPTQSEAVAWSEGPMFVLAGPGSGKTRILTTRIGRLLADSPDRAFRVLALTFTNKAADEMTARVAALVPELEKRAVIGTFHSFCMQILQQHGTHIGIQPDFVIYSLDSDRKELMKEAMRIVKIDDDAGKFLTAIDKLKSRLVGPIGCASLFNDVGIGQRIETVYSTYENVLRKSNALDFGSLIAETYRLIAEFPGIAIRIRKTYRYWMFDEFQDTTDSQYRLIKMLAGEDFRNIFAVADDDQIIYQWNGASFQQIQRFRADFKPNELQLPTNYRCPPVIVSIANQLVSHNSFRTASKQPLEAGKKILRYPIDQHLAVWRFATEDSESAGIASSIASMKRDLWGETAVLARTRTLLEKIHAAIGAAGVKSAIAQRRDDFRSPVFQWICSILKITLRPLDRITLEVLVGSFNRMFDTRVQVDEVVAGAAISARSFLEEWAEQVREQCNSDALALISKAIECGHERSRYKSFVDHVLMTLPKDDGLQSDVEEDHAAWKDISRSIFQSMGQATPLEQFLQELSIRSKEPPIARDTVALMTIHGAKGKEFDHVFVVGLAEDILPSFQSLKAGEASAEMEEERRNCFVAITRAREWLCLTYSDKYRGYTKRPSRFLTEMGVPLPATATT